MIELQFINKLLATKDFSQVVLNDIDESYFDNEYKDYFRFIKNHYDEYGKIPDVETFIGEFKNFEIVTVSEPMSYLISAVQEQKLYTKLVDVLKDTTQKMNNGDSNAAVEFLLNQLPKLNVKTTYDAIDLIHDTTRFDEYLERCEHRDEYYISTGLPELDKIIGGWDVKDEVATITARTNQGKSWWLLYFLFIAAKQGHRVGIYSGEMTPSKVGYRIDTFFSHISNYKISKGYEDVKDQYRQSIEDMKSRIAGNVFIITPKDLGGSATVPKLKAFCERYKLEMLGVDQISLMDDIRHNAKSFEGYANISRDIRIMQSELRIPVLMVSQIGRGVEKGEDAGTENIAGSDRIGQDSTIVLTITQKDGKLEIKIIKSRDSRVGDKLVYMWDIDTGSITYVPSEDSALAQRGKEDKVEDVYQTSGEESPF